MHNSLFIEKKRYFLLFLLFAGWLVLSSFSGRESVSKADHNDIADHAVTQVADQISIVTTVKINKLFVTDLSSFLRINNKPGEKPDLSCLNTVLYKRMVLLNHRFSFKLIRINLLYQIHTLFPS